MTTLKSILSSVSPKSLRLIVTCSSSSPIHESVNVIDDEPQLGKVKETTVTLDRDDIIELLIETFLEGSITSSKDTIQTPDELDTEIGEWLNNDEIETINNAMEYLLDDDYGSGKDSDLILNYLTDMIDNNAKYEYETQEYK